jgi:hypothetical protein
MSYKIIQNEDPDIIEAAFNMEEREHLFWHCKLFSFTAPKIIKDNDPFEDVVLSLFENNITDLGIIADKTCLSKEFVATVYDRLVAKSYIDKSNKRVLVSRDKQESQYQTLYGFQDTVSKKVLPHFFENVPDMFEGELDKRNKSNLYLAKGRGYISGLIVENQVYSNKDEVSEVDEDLKRELTGATILDALKIKYSRDLNSPCLLMKNPNSINSELVSINDKTDDVYLYCSKFIQKGNRERLLISDGFDSDVSDLFILDYLSDSKNIRKKRNRETNYSRDFKNNRKIFELSKIKESIDGLEKYNNVDENKNYEDQYAKIITDLYRTLEFIMLEAYLKNPLIKDYSLFLPSKENLENSQFITDESVKIGFNKCKIRFRADGIKKIKLGCKDPEMEALLNLFILKEIEGNKNSLRSFAADNPDFIQFLDGFKGMRDPATHTKAIDNKQDLNEVYPKVLKFYNFLFPIRQDDIENVNNKRGSRKASDDLMKNSIETLKGRLGEIGYYKQDDFIKHNLLAFELDIRQSSSYTIITDLDIILSHLYEQKIKNKQIKEKQIRNVDVNNYSTKKLYERLSRNKFEMEYFELASLKRVNPYYIKKTLENTKTYTLGSCYLAYLWLLDDKELVEEREFKITSVISTVLKHRGHGEKIGMIIDDDELKGLIDSLYKYIRNTLVKNK